MIFACWISAVFGIFIYIVIFILSFYFVRILELYNLFLTPKNRLGMPTVAPPTMRPLPRPDVTPPPSGTTLLYAQGQQIGALPLNGTRMDKERSSVLLTLHVRFLYSLFMCS